MLQVETVSEGETILRAIGVIADEAADDFSRRIGLLVAGRAATITLDLSKCEGINSRAIGKLLLVRTRMAEQNRVLRIRGCAEELWKIFKMIKMDTLIPMER